MSVAWEILYMSIMVYAASYWLHYRAFDKGLGDAQDIVKTKALKKDAEGKKRDYKTGHKIIDKWLAFGGGYYGIVALIKLIFIELAQFWSFITDGEAIGEFINTLGLATIVNFFMDQLKNFIAAVIWPVDYLNSFSLLQVAMFIGVTYFACEYARKTARQKLNVSQQE